MSNFIPSQEYDKFSSASFKSGASFEQKISNMSFRSRLPLPPVQKIPQNQQISNCYSELENQFPEVDPDQMVQLMYKNCIVPKINEQVRSERSMISRNSINSGHSKASSQLLSFTIHENKSHIRPPPQEEPTSKKKKKKKKKSSSKDKQERAPPGYQNKRPKGENENNLKKAQEWTNQGNKEHHFQNQDIEFNNKDELINYEEKKLAAKAFCDRGHGLDKLKEEVWQADRTVLDMSKKRYQQVAFNFMSQSFRTLQRFLIEDCNRNIKPLTHAQIKALVPCLTHAQLRVNEQDYLTLRKFIRVTYNLGSVSIFEQMTVSLYIRAQILLRGKIGPNRLERQYKSDTYQKREMLRSPGRFLNQRLESDGIWTRPLEYELVDLVVELRTIARAREKLRQKYGQNPTLNNVKELKARYFKILRISTQRLLKLTKEEREKLPYLVPFDDEKVKVLIRHPTAHDARHALARLYKVPGFDKPLLSDAILKVNQFCRLEDIRREQQLRQKQPVINSVTDKIKHNIKVSAKLLHNVTAPSERVGPEQQLLFIKKNQDNYQHIVSLEHDDKLHYFRRTGVPNNKGGFEYKEKQPQLRKLQMQDGDDNSEHEVMVSDDDYVSEGGQTQQQNLLGFRND